MRAGFQDSIMIASQGFVRSLYSEDAVIMPTEITLQQRKNVSEDAFLVLMKVFLHTMSN